MSVARMPVVLLALVLASCGGSAPPTEPPARRLTGERALDDDDEAPRFVLPDLSLPEPPASVDVDDPALETVLGFAREILGRPPPVPEETLAAAEVSGFVEGRLATWMNAQAQSIRGLWTAMQGLETRALGAHVVARAIAGATLAVLAARIDGLALPASASSDPDRDRAIDDALAAVAAPIRERAVQALGACASTAVGSADPTIDEWRLFCDAETDRARTP